MPRAQTPPSRSSKSAAVRRALERPSARQLSKWQRERRQRRVIWGLAIAVPLLIAAVLGFGYWQENIARGSETAATLYGATVTMDDLVPWVTPRVKGVEQVLSMYRAQGMTQAESQLGQQLNRVPDQVVNDRVEAVLI